MLDLLNQDEQLFRNKRVLIGFDDLDTFTQKAISFVEYETIPLISGRGHP